MIFPFAAVTRDRVWRSPSPRNVYTATHYSQRRWDTWSAELAVVKQPTFKYRSGLLACRVGCEGAVLVLASEAGASKGARGP